MDQGPQISDESARFRQLQKRLAPLFDRIMIDKMIPRTVVVVPSLSLDEEVLRKITGVSHYEERMLSLLLLLRLPRTRVIYVTSEPVPETIVDYYLHLLPGIPHRHARERLELITAHDGGPKPLSAKILARPHLVSRLKKSIGETENVHMTCFNVTELERDLALELDIPIYGCDPDLRELGSKSGSRRAFRAAELPMPDGSEDLTNAEDVIGALADLYRTSRNLKRAVVKLNEGFSGEGNAVFEFAEAPEDPTMLEGWIAKTLPKMHFEADMDWPAFEAKLKEMGGIVEAFIEGEGKRSPSAQMRVSPKGEVELLSTHDQVLGGPQAQEFLGCIFPADSAYRTTIEQLAMRAGQELANEGVIGRFGVDFISVPTAMGWEHYAIEINLRKGGTTHPYLMLQYLTGGNYDVTRSRFVTSDGDESFYVATDNLESEDYKGLTPYDLIDIAVCNGIHFDAAKQSGVVFHLIGALSEFGKLGMVAIAPTPDKARKLYDETVSILDRESTTPRH